MDPLHDPGTTMLPPSFYSPREDAPYPLPLPLYNSSDLRNFSSECTVQTGTGLPFLRRSPEHPSSSESHEPLAVPKDDLLAECMRREADRVARQDSLFSRLVYDSIEPCPVNAVELASYYTPDSPQDVVLVFESRFETGNLRRVIQLTDYEYDLILKPDYNTRGNTQWFYFTVGNTRKGIVYRFNFVNMMKPDSLYNWGMKPCVYSQKEAELSGKPWFRDGFDICYYQSPIKKKAGGNYFTLTFALTFKHDFDTVSIAHCYPYSYSDLNKELNKLLADPRKRNRVQRRTLCSTIAGNPCDILTVTNFSSPVEVIRKRIGVFLMSRVHPGETNSSWMMKGLLDYITGPTLDAKVIRDNFIVKIIPMLNPDGVINGNYRCGLAGCDLNRCWPEPSRRFHPTIYYAKSALKQFTEERDVIMVCDFHGHSRKKNVFIYGCTSKHRVEERVFPYLMARSSEIFSFADCAFGIQKARESTARIVLHKEFGLVNSYTVECSFCGADFGRHAGCHFGIQHLLDIGHDFCDALLNYCDPDQGRVRAAMEELQLACLPGTEEEEDGEATVELNEEKRGKKKKKGAVKKKVAKKSK